MQVWSGSVKLLELSGSVRQGDRPRPWGMTHPARQHRETYSCEEKVRNEITGMSFRTVQRTQRTTAMQDDGSNPGLASEAKVITKKRAILYPEHLCFGREWPGLSGLRCRPG